MNYTPQTLQSQCLSSVTSIWKTSKIKKSVDFIVKIFLKNFFHFSFQVLFLVFCTYNLYFFNFSFVFTILFSIFYFLFLRKFMSSFCSFACYIYIKFYQHFRLPSTPFKISISDVSKFQKKLHFLKCSRCFFYSKRLQTPIFSMFLLFSFCKKMQFYPLFFLCSVKLKLNFCVFWLKF